MGKKQRANRNRDGSPSGPMNAGPVVEIRGRRQFETQVIDSEIPVVVDFWGSRCAPCLAMAPTFQACAQAFAGQAKFVKVNTEINAQIARSFNIRSVPTLAVFYRGEVFDVHVGAAQQKQIGAMVRRVLDKHQGVGFMDKIKRIWSKGTDN